ncbi:MAG: hypothetical protein AAGF24_12190 [Cyanobacteria bacterium P01_H01_bin.121]
MTEQNFIATAKNLCNATKVTAEHQQTVEAFITQVAAHFNVTRVGANLLIQQWVQA